MNQRAGQRQLLLHAARELIGETAAKLRELGHVEQAIAAPDEIADAVDLREERDVLVDAQVAVQREALREVADRAGDVAMLLHRILAEHADRARVDMQQPADRADRRRLAGAVGTNQPEHLAFVDTKRHPAQRLDAAVPLDDVLELNCCFHIGLRDC